MINDTSKNKKSHYKNTSIELERERERKRERETLIHTNLIRQNVCIFNFITDLTAFTTFAPFAPFFRILSSDGSFLGRGFMGKLGRALSSAAITTVLDPGCKNYIISNCNIFYHHKQLFIMLN